MLYLCPRQIKYGAIIGELEVSQSIILRLQPPVSEDPIVLAYFDEAFYLKSFMIRKDNQTKILVVVVFIPDVATYVHVAMQGVLDQTYYPVRQSYR